MLYFIFTKNQNYNYLYRYCDGKNAIQIMDKK